jgi:hypothetical protein
VRRERCDFCRGRAVLNGAAWVDPSAPRYVPCPRCGFEVSESVRPAPEVGAGRAREQDRLSKGDRKADSKA